MVGEIHALHIKMFHINNFRFDKHYNQAKCPPTKIYTLNVQEQY